MYYWLKEVLESEYRLVRNIKRKEDCIINVMENKNNNKRVLVKYIEGDVSVYKELINVRHKNLPFIYEVASCEKSSIIIR